ncbi:MAG: hypothetical protein IJA34_00590 [Lachnospiraceae bacterium]|nr:hypothetical protein [Lachnospiraceae bacterium]
MINCIDIKNKFCVFGYGGISVNTVGQRIIFKGIKPPVGAGTQLYDNDKKVGEWEYTGNEISILFNTIDEIKIICDCLNLVEKNQMGLFEFKDITFDFMEYKQVSMDIVRAAIEKVRLNIIKLMAC